MRFVRKLSIMTSIMTMALAATLPATSNAYDPIVTSQRWERVAYSEDETCRAEIGTNGKFYIIRVYGLAPKESGNLYLTNEDILPVSLRVKANAGGEWSNYYIPFLWGHQSGLVNVSFDSPTCSVDLSFAWKRQGVKVHG